MGDYFDSENRHSVKIDQYDLFYFAKAQQRYEKLLAEREEVFASFYWEITPTVTSLNPYTGMTKTSSGRTDQMAFEIIEKKEIYQASIRREQRAANMFRIAMFGLTESERQAIQRKYLSEEESFDLFEFSDLLSVAENKLGRLIEQEEQKVIDKKVKKKKEALKKIIANSNLVRNQEDGK